MYIYACAHISTYTHIHIHTYVYNTHTQTHIHIHTSVCNLFRESSQADLASRDN